MSASIRYEVRLSQEALRSIEEQYLYISNVAHAPLTGMRWFDRIVEAANSLENMPRRCALAAESADMPFEVRALNVDGFLLLFKIEDDRKLVTILFARHGRQLPYEKT